MQIDIYKYKYTFTFNIIMAAEEASPKKVRTLTHIFIFS